MRPLRTLIVLWAGVLAACVGCEASRRLQPVGPTFESVERQAGKPVPHPARGSPDETRQSAPGKSSTPIPASTARRAAFTAENNPTRRDLRGDPSLEDFYRPAAWVYIDGREGRFIERDGRPQVQWQIEGLVSASPTFRVEVFSPLLGTPTNFVCTVDLLEAPDGTNIAYAIRAVEGTFILGHDYSLLRPGDNFVVRNRTTGDVVNELAPLVPGTYMLAAGIKNVETGKEALAITYFTVGQRSGEYDTQGEMP